MTGARPEQARGASACWIAAFVAWLALLGAATYGVWRYKTTPGAAPRTAPARFPAELGALRVPGSATIVMLAHPKCACTRASLGELARLMSALGPRARARVLFWSPAGTPQRWAQSDNWASAARIPGVRVAADEGGRAATLLGATTSGHTLVYDAGGALVFSGGITSARGHAGDSVGRERILWALGVLAAPGTPAAVASTAQTFGCSLDERPRQEPL